MTQSTARIHTEYASRYLQQLCKHFAHKIPVEFTRTDGRIDFDGNACVLKADGDVLTITVEAADNAAVERLQDVVVRHLERFAFRDKPDMTWTAA
jgi:hypothetical protein